MVVKLPSRLHLCLPPLQCPIFSPYPNPFLPLRPSLSVMIRQAMLYEISNSAVRREGEWREVEGNAEGGKNRGESPPSFFLLRGTGQVPTSMYFTVWLGGHRECWLVMHGVMSLCPCPLSLPCQANDDDDDNEKEEEEKEKGTLRTWLSCSLYRFL